MFVHVNRSIDAWAVSGIRDATQNENISKSSMLGIVPNDS